MFFFINFTGESEQRTLTYCENEYSFDMSPWKSNLDFDLSINQLCLTVVDGKIIQLSGFCGLSKKMISDFLTPESKKGELRILNVNKYLSGVGSYGISDEEFPVYINIVTGWVCVGFPEKKGFAVEFIDNCIAVISDKQKLVSLWLKPLRLPSLS